MVSDRQVNSSMKAAPPASTGPCPRPEVSTTDSWAPKAAAAAMRLRVAGELAVASSRAERAAVAASRATDSRVPETGRETAAQVVSAMAS